MKFLTIILIIAIACLATNCKRSNVTDDIASIEDYTYNRLFKDISVLSINERYRCDAKEYKVFDISYESDSLTVHTKFIPSTPEFWVCSSVVYDNNCNRIYIPLEEANYELFLRFKENKEKLSSLDNAYDIIEKFNLMGINWVDNPKQYILIDSTGKGHIISK